MARLIGTFKAKQQRERLLRRNNYSHLIAVFDEGVLMIEARPKLDKAAAAFNFVPGLGHVPGVGHYVSLAKALYALAPAGAHTAALLAELDHVTPEAIIAAFPEHVRGLETEQIRSAVLRSKPPELRLKYRVGAADHQLWLKLPLTESVEPAYEIMRELLGQRLTRASASGGLLDAALDLLPG